MRSAHPANHPRTAIRVLLADDHRLFRACVKEVLSTYPSVTVVGEATDGEEAVERSMRLRPDLVVMDINMPKLNGVEATRRIKQVYPNTVVVGLSVNAGKEYSDAMKRAGASRTIPKDRTEDQLYEEIQAALAPSRKPSKRSTATRRN